jgi:uncharacterized protein
MLKRILNLELPESQSLFLWGARKTGKSTYLKQTYPNSLYIDFLHHETYLRYSKNPSLLREELRAYKSIDEPIIIDEVQKVPEILDEVHWMIENMKGISFILCGSSLRKLKHTGANLLGGRAWRQLFFPLCYPELPEFNLLKIFNHGLLPQHYLSEGLPARSLEGYIVDYIIPEVQWEGQIRNLGAFNRFLESIAFSNCEMLNYSNIARECGVNIKTAQGYVSLICDMLLGYLITPYTPRTSRQLIMSAPKFYFFDLSLSQFLLQKEIRLLKGSDAGHALEQYVFLELMAYKELNKKRLDIKYWRTKNGLEVDFILGKGEIAIEVKLSTPVGKHDLNGLIAFATEHKPRLSIVVGLEPIKRIMNIDDIEVYVYPIEQFLQELWKGEII